MSSIKFEHFTLILTICIIGNLINETYGHGRLIEPPSRASAWRYGFQTPPNYNDHELYCGGFTKQWNINGGKCGECGDAWDSPLPRPHEAGGKWGQGVVVRKYNPGADITIRIELTASHMGYFEFRLCPDIKAKQECLDKNVLKIINGAPIIQMPNDLETRFYPRNGSRIYDIKAQLPEELKCDQCVLQWRYIAGNNWGTCPDGTGMVGCGPQEEFRACADIAIGDTGRTTIRPIRPGVKKTTTTTSTKYLNNTTNIHTKDNNTSTTDADEYSDLSSSIYLALLIIGMTLLIVLCILAAIYLYYYHGQRVKQLLRWKRQQVSTTTTTTNQSNNTIMTAQSHNKINNNHSGLESTINVVPIPPPRTKRLSQSLNIKDLSADDLSVA